MKNKNNKRNYKVKFRLCIGDPTNQRPANFLRYYMPRWSKFMRIIMGRKLPALASPKFNGPASVKELPALRKVVGIDLKTEDVAPLLEQYDPELKRMLLDTHPFFDAAPQDLKVHILAVFGVTASVLEEYLDNLKN